MTKIKNKQTKRLLIIAACLIILAGILLLFLFNRKSEERIFATEDAGLIDAIGVPITTDYINEESDRRPQITREIKWIVIHETDNRGTTADAVNHNSFLHNDDSQVNSWHYTVDSNQIYHHMPDNEVAWHAGDKKTEDGGNMTGIGIEMCVNKTGDYEQTLRNTAKLVAALLNSYNLTMEEVKFHKDFSGKICPHRLYTEGRIKEFLEMIEIEYNGLKAGESDESK
ncbi:peptidoglycan recognition protein family protein [Anaerorhabdus sp.]|jgi:N-acetylmuramoyl-L-alanine amidase CwlA|uniref:peptidoglycan recognition protein family protein n=1 Tax=Anaerorhabdus sp. TaxID=1872524 RepID=UPI002FC59350